MPSLTFFGQPSFKLFEVNLRPRKVFSEELAPLKDAVCQNQGEYIQYYHCAHQLHTSLRIAVDNAEDVHTLQHLAVALDTFLNDKLEHVMRMNLIFLEKLFIVSRSHKASPRICTKASIPRVRHDGDGFVVDMDETKLIYDMVRHGDPSYYNTPFEVTDNTGFYRVSVTGRYYINNDIPKEARHSTYKNPRLSDKDVALYKPPLRDALPLLGYVIPSSRDYRWERCWTTYQGPSGTTPPEASYKSTLIIPITLWNNQFDHAFVTLMRKTLRVHEFQRYIFAFLCFDHRECNYFDEKKDVKIGYMFADILSLYLFTKWPLTHLSSAYHQYHDVVKRMGCHQ